jgi:hypothetical protein
MRHSNRMRKRNRGLATLEMAMLLPFACLLLMVIFSLASISLSWMSVTADVRRLAWQHRYAPWKQDTGDRSQTLSLPDAADVGLILGPQPPAPPNGDLAVGLAERDVALFYEGFRGRIGKAKGDCALLGGVWDFREMPFENSRNGHPPLTPTPKWKYLRISGISSLRPFGRLLDF